MGCGFGLTVAKVEQSDEKQALAQLKNGFRNPRERALGSQILNGFGFGEATQRHPPDFQS
jgi:hypothetical protein